MERVESKKVGPYHVQETTIPGKQFQRYSEPGEQLQLRAT